MKSHQKSDDQTCVHCGEVFRSGGDYFKSHQKNCFTPSQAFNISSETSVNDEDKIERNLVVENENKDEDEDHDNQDLVGEGNMYSLFEENIDNVVNVEFEAEEHNAVSMDFHNHSAMLVPDVESDKNVTPVVDKSSRMEYFSTYRSNQHKKYD